MARLAGSYNSKDDDDFGAPRMSASAQWSPPPAVKSVSLIDALKMVDRGEVAARELFSQLPPELAEIMNRAAKAAGGSDFNSLTSDEQKCVMASLLVAINGNAAAPASSSAATSSPKRAPAALRASASVVNERKSPWWKFW